MDRSVIKVGAKHALMRMSFNTKRRIGFYQDMANAIDAGIAPVRALSQMLEVSRPRRSLRWLVALLQPMISAAKDGASLARAIQPWVPNEDAALLSVGEDTGQLSTALRELVRLLQDKRDIIAALRRNLIPAGAMATALISLMVIMARMLGAEVKKMMPPEVLNSLSVLPGYIAAGDWVIHWGPYLAITAVLAAIAIWVSLTRWAPDSARSWLDTWIPPWSFSSRVQAVFFLISVSSMMQAGRTFRSAVEQLLQFSSPWSKAHLRQMLARLRAGQPEVRSMQVGMLPEDVADRLNFYALLPDFGKVMKETARDSMTSLVAKVDVMGNVMRVVMMLLLAGFVIVTLLSVYDMSDGVEKAAKMQMQR